MDKKEMIIYLTTGFINYHWQHKILMIERRGVMVIACEHCNLESVSIVNSKLSKIKEE